MSNTVRLIIAMVAACALAMLATPEIAAHLPAGLAQALALGIAAALHRMNAEAPKAECEHEAPKAE